ncbi:serine/threonine-protein kinase [Polyangium sp. y55x31]|uniref:serine/threonine protein kinase n=1 Tax=Polyangium sp. y55x31 TaxID=3042688 RepID=UPI0024825234|nr:serine/threonine-protein kinase [Polyangium sp. y55x31]MDI1475506.1 serine/threonine-protein kinase [Polyangium sp. y55x31]
MPETKKITPGLVIAGRYRVIREIGRGAVGSVHLVQHVHTDEQFALKVLHDPAAASPEKIARFRVEARAPARIDSDHVVRITDADVAPELNGAPFFVMEYLRGRDLGAELDMRGVLPVPEVVLYMRQAARALDKAHALGIVHRDLKPENLFLIEREDGVPCIKLVDFGIAKLTGDAATIAQIVSRTQTGRIFGTPLFMSPEQATGRVSLVGPATDVWALGLVTNRLLTGRDHFESDTVAELIGKIAYDPIRPPSELGAALGPSYDAWFLRCCHRELGKRFRSAGEAVTALAAALGIEEGDALIDAVISSRRALGGMAYSETMRAPPSSGRDSIDILLDALESKAPPPASALPASAPAVSASSSALPVIKPPPVPRLPATLSDPALPAHVPTPPPSTTTISADAVVRPALDIPPAPRASRGSLYVGLAVAAALAAGLVLGIGFIQSSGTDAPLATTSATPAASGLPSSARASLPPKPSPSGSALLPAASVAPAPSASAAPSVLPRGTIPRKDPLSGRH